MTTMTMATTERMTRPALSLRARLARPARPARRVLTLLRAPLTGLTSCFTLTLTLLLLLLLLLHTSSPPALTSSLSSHSQSSHSHAHTPAPAHAHASTWGATTAFAATTATTDVCQSLLSMYSPTTTSTTSTTPRAWLSPSPRWPQGVTLAQTYVETLVRATSGLHVVSLSTQLTSATSSQRSYTFALDTASNLLVVFNSTACSQRRTRLTPCVSPDPSFRNASLDLRATWLHFKDQEVFFDRVATSFAIPLVMPIYTRGTSTLYAASLDGSNYTSLAATPRIDVTMVSSVFGATPPLTGAFATPPSTAIYSPAFHQWLDFDGFLGLSVSPSLAIQRALKSGLLVYSRIAPGAPSPATTNANGLPAQLPFAAPRYAQNSVARNLVQSVLLAHGLDPSSASMLSADANSTLMTLDLSVRRWWLDGVPSEYANRTTWSCPAPTLPAALPTFLMYDVRFCNASLTSTASNPIYASSSLLHPYTFASPSQDDVLPVSVPAIIDSASPCVALPSEWVDILISLAPLKCSPSPPDPASPAQICYLESDQDETLLPSLQFRLSPNPDAPSFFISLSELRLDQSTSSRLCITRSGSLFDGDRSSRTASRSFDLVLPAYVGLGATALSQLVVVLDTSADSTVVGLAQADSADPSTMQARCLSRVVCRGMQDLDARINVCIDPPCSSFYLMSYDSESANCVFPAELQPLLAFALAVVLVVELALNEAVLVMKQKIRKARLSG